MTHFSVCRRRKTRFRASLKGTIKAMRRQNQRISESDERNPTGAIDSKAIQSNFKFNKVENCVKAFSIVETLIWPGGSQNEFLPLSKVQILTLYFELIPIFFPSHTWCVPEKLQKMRISA